MKVFSTGWAEGGAPRLLGRAEVPDDGMPVFEVRLFGAASAISDTYVLGTVTRYPEDGGGDPVTERAVLLGEGQRPEFLPGWRPLAS